MGTVKTFVIELFFEKRADGRFYVRSPSLSGLHLTGRNFKAIHDDIEPIVKELLYHNSKIEAEKIVWLPGLEQVEHVMTEPVRESEPVEKFLVITGRAAA